MLGSAEAEGAAGKCQQFPGTGGVTLAVDTFPISSLQSFKPQAAQHK